MRDEQIVQITDDLAAAVGMHFKRAHRFNALHRENRVVAHIIAETAKPETTLRRNGRKIAEPRSKETSGRSQASGPCKPSVAIAP